MEILLLALGAFGFTGLGLWIYHRALGNAGFLGKLAAKQAEKKLAQTGKKITDWLDGEGKPVKKFYRRGRMWTEAEWNARKRNK